MKKIHIDLLDSYELNYDITIHNSHFKFVEFDLDDLHRHLERAIKVYIEMFGEFGEKIGEKED